jgi:hypothetical protein
MDKIKVGQMANNQFVIDFDDRIIFQSYKSTIAIRYFDGTKRTVLDKYKWDYSKTTGKYRNIFLNENKKETERKIKEGIYTLEDLN